MDNNSGCLLAFLFGLESLGLLDLFMILFYLALLIICLVYF